MSTIITPLHINTTCSQIQINRKLPKVYIDQSQCFSESGLKGPIELTREEAKIGYKAALEGISRRVGEGDRMASIENNRPAAIPEIAFQNSFDVKEFTFVSMPRSRPKIEVDGYLEIQWKEGKINFSKESVLEYKYRTTKGRLVDVKL